jgi:hypothetical protein
MADEKLAVFKPEDYSEEAGEDVGPLFVIHDEDESPEVTEWMPRSAARKFAEERGYEFEVDGMTDEELEAFKKAQGY